ncbi:PP2C family protein-serine/threonine phosphatase [Nocardioides panacisoli]|uniref:PAS domain S-box protein n=1 Tax=Nocardioides panacisoli TaxID=627624 RepID=A0ABP7ICD8_9ACTN
MREVRPEQEFSADLMNAARRMARIGSWSYDLVGEELRVSPEFSRIVGRDLAELAGLGYPAFLSRLVDPEEAELVRSVLDEATAGDEIELEVRMRRPDGTAFHAAVRGEAAARAAGGVVVHGWLQDITDRRLADETLARAHATAEVAAREHQIAAELQDSLLPPSSFEVDHLRIATLYRPGQVGTEVGGDWYDVISLADGRTALVIGDVMGHGIHAAVVMGQLRTAVRAYARIGMPAHVVMESVDRLMLDLFPDQIATCLYAEFDPRSLVVRMVTAGHVPPIVREPSGTTRRLELTTHPPFGLGRPFAEPAEATLRPGDVLVLYTDGLVERRDRDVEMGIAALRDTVGRLTGPLTTLPGQLTAEMLPHGPEDDVALLLAEVAT